MTEQILMTGAKTDTDGRLITSPEIQMDTKALSIEGTYFTAAAGPDVETDSPLLSFSTWVEIFGVTYGLVGGHVGDWCRFEIVDMDNILGYGPGTVVARYGERVYLVPNEQRNYIFNFKKDVPPGLYFRVTYHNNGNDAAQMVLNYLLRK